MLSFRQTHRNYTVLLITSLGIIGLVLYYLIIFVPDNEQRINARNFRVLHRIGANLCAAIDNYTAKIAQGYGKQTLEEHFVPESFPAGGRRNIPLTVADVNDRLEKLSEKKLIEARDNGLSFSPEHGQAERNTHIEKVADVTYLHFASLIDYPKSDPYPVKFTFDSPFYFHSKIRIDSLLTPLMRWDSFEYFVLFRKKGAGQNQTAEIIYTGGKNNNHKNPVDLMPADSLLVLAGKNAGKAPAEVTVAGESFRLYFLNKPVSPRENWVFCAAVPADRYEAERRAIPGHIVTFFCLGFGLLLFSLPFLKLLLINKRERLNKSDIVFAGLSVFAGVAMLVLLLLDGYAYYIADSHAEEKRLEKLGAEIQSNLIQEISGLITKLYYLDSLPDPRRSVVDLRRDKVLAPYFTSGKAAGTGADYYSPHLIRVFWLDSAGHMVTTWTANQKPDRRYNVKSRSYFRNVVAGQGWSLGDLPVRFALESVPSMIDGRKYAVISIKSARSGHNKTAPARVAALTTKLASLYHAVLPPGYGFCVIDKEGTVLFHQQEKLNLNENLLEETSFPPALKAALYSRVATHFEMNYQGNKQRLYVAPLSQLPLFLVTYVNRDYQKVANLHLIMVTVMMLTGYFALLGFLLALVVYIRSRPAKLHLYWFAFKWLWPKSSYAHLYLRTGLFLLATILLVLWLSDPDRPVSTFYILVFAATYNFIFCYTSLHAIPIRLVFHSRLYSFSVTSVVILLVLNGCALITGTNTFMLGVLFQVVLLGLFYGINRLFYFYSPNAGTWKHRYRTLYNGMLLCWLLLTSALPAFLFFRIAYNYETELTLRYDQLYLAQALARQSALVAWPNRQRPVLTTAGPEAEGPAAADSFVYARFLYDTGPSAPAAPAGQAASRSARPVRYVNKWSGMPADTTGHRRLPAPFFKTTHLLDSVRLRATQQETRQTNEFVRLVRPRFRNVLADAFFLKANCKPGTYCHPNHWEAKDGLLHFTYTNELNQHHQIQLSSRLPRFQLPAVFQAHSPWPVNIHYPGWFFWADAAILAIFVYFLISFLVQRIFSLDLHWIKPISKIDREFLDPTIKNKLLVIALPVAPGIKELIREQHRAVAKPFRVTVIDLAKADFTSAPHSLAVDAGHLPVVLLIKNFDFDPYSQEALTYKVALLQQLNALPRLKIIIQTSLHPACWQEKLAEGEAEKHNGEKGVANAAYYAVLEQLLIHLGAYIKLYQPLQSPVPAPAPTTKYLISGKDHLLRLIHQECSSCYHLHQFEDTLVKYVEDCAFQKKKVTKEDIIFLLQERAQLYYRYIWTSCSEEEHYFLYDLAQDGLANARNKHVLSALLGKGLLVQEEDTSIKIMNASFRDFVLNVVDPAEALRYEKINAQSSKWDLYKTPLLLIFIAGALFIFFTQKQTWLNIAAVLAAFSTIMGILPRLGVLLPALFAGKEAKANQ